MLHNRLAKKFYQCLFVGSECKKPFPIRNRSPSMTSNTLRDPQKLDLRSRSADLIDCSKSYLSKTSTTQLTLEKQYNWDWMNFLAKSPKVLHFFTSKDWIRAMPSRINTVWSRSKGSREWKVVTSDSSWWQRSALQHFLIVPSSWKGDVGIGPIGNDKTFSTVTSSRLFASTSARRKTNSANTI